MVEQPSDHHRAANKGSKPVVIYLANLLLKKGQALEAPALTNPWSGTRSTSKPVRVTSDRSNAGFSDTMSGNPPLDHRG